MLYLFGIACLVDGRVPCFVLLQLGVAPLHTCFTLSMMYMYMLSNELCFFCWVISLIDSQLNLCITQLWVAFLSEGTCYRF